MPHYFCILQSETTKQYYVGESVDVAARLLKHNAKSTTSTKTRGFLFFIPGNENFATIYRVTDSKIF
ncbi:GIY-YIG nuclease family protein [Chitinophaga sp. CC14]|uniref:GIY-YIG nuclease family protein n=1 Tax=Chitinophaga sp. CC14 TaxID=3029199 RepID=UPI003B97DEF3